MVSRDNQWADLGVYEKGLAGDAKRNHFNYAIDLIVQQ